MLWVSRATTAAMTPLADKLDKDVARLVRLVRTAGYQPAQVANGAKELMDEIGASKVTGEEDRYSHTDLYDFQANVEGARAVYDAIAPLLVQRAPTLDAAIEKEFANVERVLAPHRRAAGWVSYTLANVPASERRVLSRAVDGLAEPLSKMPAIVAR
jgi:iron uptake system component EfeO